MSQAQSVAAETVACVVYCPKGMNGRVVEATMGVWFDKAFSDDIDPIRLERLRTAAEASINFIKYEAFQSGHDRGLRIRTVVMASNRQAFMRAARSMSDLIKRHLGVVAQHQQLTADSMVHRLIS